VANDIISKKTRNEFQEYFVGRTRREIEHAFDAADVPRAENFVPVESSVRRAEVAMYYHTVDFSKWTEARRVLQVFENVLTELEHVANDPDIYEQAKSIARIQLANLAKWLRKDGFEFRQSRLVRIGDAANLAEVSETAGRLDAPELVRQLDRLRVAVDDDPGLAIGTAKELVETVCKTILHDSAVTFDENAEVTALVKEARKQLQLLPEQIPNVSRGSETITTLLRQLGAIAQSLAELRNLYGTGHGRTGKTKGLSPRHARLAVGAASTLAMFLMETHAERKKKL
jgi:hypothetical protein